jgi:Spy/CpxP family protein refolding chaperone
MHPGMFGWWKSRHAHCASETHAGDGWGHHGHGHGHGRGEDPYFAAAGHGGWDDGGGFGVRRPLRFMAHKLELSQEQVGELAKILSDLKAERAQGAVDERRSTGSLADALASEAFDKDRAKGALDGRVKSAERLREAVYAALERIHAMLTPEQRQKLAYLMRTGALSV